MASGDIDNFRRFFRVSVKGADNEAKSLMNHLYHPAVPRKLRTSLGDFGTGIFNIALIFSGSVFRLPFPIIPRYRNSLKQNSTFSIRLSGWLFEDILQLPSTTSDVSQSH